MCCVLPEVALRIEVSMVINAKKQASIQAIHDSLITSVRLVKR